MKYIVNISRIIVGIIFIISGFVKAVDPIGFGYKLEEYFAPDVFNIAFLHDLALVQATFFSVFEIMLGVFLLLGIFRKFTSWSLLILIIFFTFLTFYSAYFNKVTDCGCFGDAMKLTPWQSFWKDIFLLVLIIIIFLGQKYIRPLFENKNIAYGISIAALLFSSVIAYSGIRNLPLIDFRAYAVGKNIPEGMKSAEELGLQPPKYEVLYTMKNNQTGEIIQITDTEYVNNPKWYEEGTPWELQSQLTENKKIANGYEPPIHDFVLDCDGEDMTDAYLNESKIVFFVMPFSNEVSREEIEKLNLLQKGLNAKNIKTIGLVSSDLEANEFPICYVDQITLKTMIRTNPGIISMEKGTVVGKFDDTPIPTADEVLKSFSN